MAVERPQFWLIALRRKLAQIGVGQARMTDLDIIGAHAHWSPWDEYFNEAGDVASLAAGGSGVTPTVIVSYTVPVAMLGCLDKVGIAVQDPGDWDRLTFQLQINNRPIPGFDNISGPIGSIEQPADIFWPIMSGQTVRVVAWNADATIASQTAGAMLRGRVFAADQGD